MTTPNAILGHACPEKSSKVLSGVCTELNPGDGRKVIEEVIDGSAPGPEECGEGIPFDRWVPEPPGEETLDGVPTERRINHLDIPVNPGVFG